MFYWLFKKKLNRAFKKNRREHAFRSFDNMDTILILFDYKDKDTISNIAKDLRENGKKVLLWTLLTDEARGTSASISGLRTIKKEELSFWKTVSKTTKDEYLSLTYDTLFNFTDLDVEPKNVLHYLLAINSSEFCVGTQQPDNYRVFDFVMLQDEWKTIPEIYEQIKLYTGKNIRSSK